MADGDVQDGLESDTSDIDEDGRDRSRWTRQYPPILSLFGALLIAVAVLPSSLNVPQTPPTQTLEFAPVPPEDQEDPPPPQGNFDDLGLGSTQSLSGDGAAGGDEGGTTTIPLGAPPPPSKSENPSNTRCVGNPPRQTENPLSPPCVAFFEGDNFGTTYQGVTGDEIRILIYVDGNIAETGGAGGREPRPTLEYFDLFEPPDEDGEHSMIRAFRVWQQYFNDRFQLYGRRAHFYMYFTGFDHEPKNRRADAADNFLKIEPFAVLSHDVNDNEDVYLEAMAAKGVLNFGSFSGRTKEFFEEYAKLIWGYSPSIEQQVASYLDYVCKKVIPEPAVLSGNLGQNGEPRKIGVIHTSDPNYAGLLLVAREVKKGIEECGGEIAATGTYDHCCYFQDNSATPQYAQTQMAEFQQKGISTILYLGGIEGYYGEAAQNLGYAPEWVVLGLGNLDGNNPVRLAGYSSVFDGRAVVVTPETHQPALNQQVCYQAFRTVDTSYPDADLGFHCQTYTNLFQLFVGIQVAGPRLGPTSIDKGFHAIPAVRSEDPRIPACFYLPGDYTCVKDAQAKIWDAGGQAPGDSRPGCWRSIEGGKRYLANDWPTGNIDAQITGEEPCDGHSETALLHTSPTR